MAFAQGAVQAACWLVGQSVGRYDMQDVLADQESNT
jgi:dihydrodipicolinate reductase